MKKNVIEFFKSSPLTRGQITMLLIGGLAVSLIFIIGGIYLLVKEPRNIGIIPYILLGCITGSATVCGINIPKMEKLLGADKKWEDYPSIEKD